VERVRSRLAHWGVVIEQAGLISIAPTRPTLRLTQLRLRMRERQRVLEQYARAGLAPETALALLGSSRHIVGKSAHRYRKRQRRAQRRPAQTALPRSAGPTAESPVEEFLEGLFTP